MVENKNNFIQFKEYPLSFDHVLTQFTATKTMKKLYVQSLRDKSKNKYKKNKEFGASWIKELWFTSSDELIEHFNFMIFHLLPMKLLIVTLRIRL